MRPFESRRGRFLCVAISASVRLAFSSPKSPYARHATRSLSGLRLGHRCDVRVWVGRMQPAQRPTIPQDGIFLNHRMQKSPGAGWRPQPVHTCCPTDWPVCLRPSRDSAVFGVDFSINRRISAPECRAGINRAVPREDGEYPDGFDRSVDDKLDRTRLRAVILAGVGVATAVVDPAVGQDRNGLDAAAPRTR